MKARVLIGASLALAAAVGFLAWQSSESPAPTSGSVSDRPATTPVMALVKRTLGVERTGCDFKVGSSFGYSLQFKNDLELSADMARSAQLPGHTVNTVVSAFIQFEVVEARASSHVLLGRFADVTAPSSVHAEELNTPFLVEVDSACQLTEFARSNDAVLIGARTQQGLLWELAWRWTAQQQERSFENARGAFSAGIATADLKNQRVAQRRLQRYTSLWDHQTGVTGEGLATITPGEAMWFESLESSETLHSPSVTSIVTVQANVKASRSDVLAGVDRSLTHYTWQNLLPMQLERREVRPVTLQERQLREAVKDQTPQEAMSSLKARVEQGVGIASAWPALMAYLEARPEQTQAVVDQLKSRDLPPEVVNPAYIALGNARTTEAREALLAIKRDTRAPPSERARAIFSLVDRPDVGAPFARELQQDSQALDGTPTAAERFVANESVLALTTMAGLHPEPEVTQIAIGTVHPLLTSGSNRTIGTALRALANLGDPSQLSTAAPFTRHADEKVRMAATRVIRRLQPRDSRDFVSEWLGRESNLWVKSELFSTMELQYFDAKAKVDPALTNQLLQELKFGEHSAIARKALVRLVARSESAESPELREALKAQAKKEFPLQNGMYSEILKHLTPEEIREVAP